jgi:hypothetical protein
LKQVEPPRSARVGGLGGNFQMNETAPTPRWLFERTNDFQLAATQATLNINVEHTFRPLR